MITLLCLYLLGAFITFWFIRRPGHMFEMAATSLVLWVPFVGSLLLERLKCFLSSRGWS